MTEEQREKENASRRARDAWYRAHGICYRCGQEDAVITGLCGACYDKIQQNHRKYREKHREENMERVRKWRSRKAAEGLCTNCGKARAEAGKKFCAACLQKARIMSKERYWRKRIERPATQCRWCERERVPGFCFCPEHLARKRDIAANMARSSKANHPLGKGGTAGRLKTS